MQKCSRNGVCDCPKQETAQVAVRSGLPASVFSLHLLRSYRWEVCAKPTSGKALPAIFLQPFLALYVGVTFWESSQYFKSLHYYVVVLVIYDQ